MLEGVQTIIYQTHIGQYNLDDVARIVQVCERRWGLDALNVGKNPCLKGDVQWYLIG